MTIQQISGVDAIPKGFEVNTENALKNEMVKENSATNLIKEDIKEMVETNKGQNIDNLA